MAVGEKKSPPKKLTLANLECLFYFMFNVIQSRFLFEVLWVALEYFHIFKMSRRGCQRFSFHSMSFYNLICQSVWVSFICLKMENTMSNVRFAICFPLSVETCNNHKRVLTWFWIRVSSDKLSEYGRFILWPAFLAFCDYITNANNWTENVS